jgi:putative oxidoreductase
LPAAAATDGHDTNNGECMTMEVVTARPPSSPLGRAASLYCAATRLLDRLQPVFALALRVYVARVFFVSGMIKIDNWAGTLGLFENEYHVPLLPPHVAAVMGTTAELVLPVFLFLGLGTRAAAIALFAFNFCAAASYPGLSAAGLKDHVLWGALLLVIVFYGPGKIALDHWLGRRFCSKV